MSPLVQRALEPDTLTSRPAEFTQPDVITPDTIATPEGAYGAGKLMSELLINEYSRRGFVDGRILRLPTIIVRPGVPSNATSAFLSGGSPLQALALSLPGSRPRSPARQVSSASRSRVSSPYALSATRSSPLHSNSRPGSRAPQRRSEISCGRDTSRPQIYARTHA